MCAFRPGVQTSSSRYATWKVFYNQYWPAIHLIDKQGRIVYSHDGEGGDDETEKRIQALLAEASPEAAPMP